MHRTGNHRLRAGVTPTIVAMELDGRHVVVTGAADGIGRALARGSTPRAPGSSPPISTATRWQRWSPTLNERPAAQRRRGRRRRRHRERATEQLVAAAEDAFGPIDLFFANAGVGIGTDLDTTEADWAAGVRRQRPRPPLGGEVPAARVAGPRRGLLLLDGVGGRAAQPDRLGAVLAHQARRRGLRRVAEHHLRRPGRAGQLPVPAGRQHQHAQPGTRPASAGAGDVVRAAGEVLEPDEVAEVVVGVIRAETFLILPHPEVLTYLQRKTGDYDRWLAGMRKLQARIVG